MTPEANAAPELPLSVLRAAYVDGWFPMGEQGTRSIEWFSPDPRGILPLTAFHVPARLARTLRAARFDIRVDTAFAEVMDRCAERDDTWISDVIRESYTALHQKGEAHSVECWRDGRLAGGLYGVALGGAFFGESMFHVETDASKVALAALVERLRARDFALLDLQWVTPHLAQFGAVEIRRGQYLQLLRQALARRAAFV
jgi:leucyl/phenylalanyl-tRNA--protein transferase